MYLPHMDGTHPGRRHCSLRGHGRDRTDSHSPDKMCFRQRAGIFPMRNPCTQSGRLPRGSDQQCKPYIHVPTTHVYIDPPRTLRNAQTNYLRKVCAVVPADRSYCSRHILPAPCVSGIDLGRMLCKLIVRATQRSDRSNNPHNLRRPQLACCARQGSWNIRLTSFPHSANALCLRRNGSCTLCNLWRPQRFGTRLQHIAHTR